MLTCKLVEPINKVQDWHGKAAMICGEESVVDKYIKNRYNVISEHPAEWTTMLLSNAYACNPMKDTTTGAYTVKCGPGWDLEFNLKKLGVK